MVSAGDVAADEVPGDDPVLELVGALEALTDGLGQALGKVGDDWMVEGYERYDGVSIG